MKKQEEQVESHSRSDAIPKSFRKSGGRKASLRLFIGPLNRAAETRRAIPLRKRAESDTTGNRRPRREGKEGSSVPEN